MSEATTYLELRDLRVSYGKVEALHGISVHVEQGEIVTILGANGAGKTTTLTTISGLRKPSGGSILFQGRPLHTIPSHEIVRLGITQSPEGRRVFGTLSVRENLDLGAFTSKDRGRSAKIRKWIFDLFPRLAEREGQLAGTLSGGEAQRLKLASEMGKAQDGALFVFDEPTIGLHPRDVRTLLNVFQHLVEQGATVVVIEHDLDFIRNADYVIDLGPGGGEAGGRIVACGTPEQIAANPDSVTGRYL